MTDYAPEYTKRERIVFIGRHLTWCVPLYVATKFWFFDWLSEYSGNANCYQYGDITGVHLVMYGLFVAMPLLLFFWLALAEGKRAIKVIKLGQNPLPNEKVFQKTKYKYGIKAKIQPIVILSFIVFMLLFSFWGAIQANEFTQDLKPCEKTITRFL